MNETDLSYIPSLIAAYKAGFATDHAHLGYWPVAAALDWNQAQTAMTVLHLDELDLRNGDTLVDIGCGLGGSLRLADGVVEQANLIGVNIDPRQLQICRSLKPMNSNKMQWIQSDAIDIPLENGVADRILSLEAMFHFSDRQSFFNEASRLLRPGGKLVCSDIQFSPCNTPETSKMLDIVTEGYAPWPVPEACSDMIVEMGRNSGLQLASMMDLTKEITPTWDHIVPTRKQPILTPESAMRTLHLDGLMNYVMFAFSCPA